MLHSTHVVFGMALMETILVSAQVVPSWIMAVAVLAAGAAATLPDIDHPHAWITVHTPLGRLISRLLEHRTLTHSLLSSLALGLIFYLVAGWNWIVMALIVGWLSHGMIDLLNPAGVRWLYPLVVWIRLPRFLTIEVGGLGEQLVYLGLRGYLVAMSGLYLLTEIPVEWRSAAVIILSAVGAMAFVSKRSLRPVVGVLCGVASYFTPGLEDTYYQIAEWVIGGLQSSISLQI